VLFAFDKSVVFNDAETFRFIRCSLVRSSVRGRSRSMKVVRGGAYGRWRGSRYQPTEGQVCQLALSYFTSRVTYCTVIPRRLGSSTARHCT